MPENKIDYQIKKSIKARHIRITIYPNGSVFVTQPIWASEQKVTSFVNSKTNWIQKKLKVFSDPNWKPSPYQGTRAEYLKYKSLAGEIIKSRVEYFHQFYNFQYNKIQIRNQKSRWGSCSRNKSLSFNYKLIFLSEQMRDYVIVHEICHLKEMNHSRKFWDLVKLQFPHYVKIRKELKKLR